MTERMMDDQLTKDMQEWVQTPPAERDTTRGAELLLKFNRNQWLYRNACRFPERYDGIVEHELRKYLRIRLDGLTQREVAQMELTVVPQAAEDLHRGAPVVSTEADPATEAQFVGRRADHDTLPEDIRGLYKENGDVYYRMKQVFTTLQGMEDKQPCDRYELLVQLKELDDRYRKNWERYDHWSSSGAESETEAPEAPSSSDASDPMATAKAISAARKYVSENMRKLSDLTSGAEIEAKLAAIQERVDLIVKNGGTFKPDFQALLEEKGIHVAQS